MCGKCDAETMSPGDGDALALLRLAPVVICDVDLCIRYWSVGAERLYGWSPDHAPGNTLHALLATELPKPYAQSAICLEWSIPSRRRLRARAMEAFAIASHVQTATPSAPDTMTAGCWPRNATVRRSSGTVQAVLSLLSFNLGFPEGLVLPNSPLPAFLAACAMAAIPSGCRLSADHTDRQTSALGPVLGIGRYSSDPDNCLAGFAVIVDSDPLGDRTAAGRRLLPLKIVTSRGIWTMFGDIARDNVATQRGCRSLGFTVAAHPDAPTSVFLS